MAFRSRNQSKEVGYINQNLNKLISEKKPAYKM